MSAWYLAPAGVAHFLDAAPRGQVAALCGTLLHPSRLPITRKGPFCGSCLRFGAPLPTTPEAPCP